MDDYLEQVEDTPTELIAFCARVSNPANQMNSKTSTKLIKYLIRHHHWSPLEMVNVCMELDTTRDISHQIVRHRSFSFQEFSQRYADPAALGDQFILSEARFQDTKNRQNSVDLDMGNPAHIRLMEEWEYRQKRVITAAETAYSWAIENGLAKEVARKVLPEGLTKTRLCMNGSLRSWIHYLQLRTANGTQKEHMQVALDLASIIATIFPITDELISGCEI